MGDASGPIRVAVMGLGHIGREVVRAVLSSPGLELTAVIDSSPQLAGRPVSELVRGAPSLTIQPNAGRVLGGLRGGVLLLATGSRLRQVMPDLEAAARAGVHVVTTCEEFAFPWLIDEQRADALDRLATSRRCSLLGTGVNPGFVLDRLAATAAGVCGPVRHVNGERVVDLLTRRESLRRRAGLGLSEQEFERGLEAGELGHVGLDQSAALCAIGVGLDYDEFEDEVRPIIAEERLEGPVRLEPGQVAGIYHRVRCFAEGREVVDLELTLAAGVQAYDMLRIDAEPKVELRVSGGYAGDEATAWAVVNAVPRIVAAEPGILTVLELPAGR
jgi:hypothetical protein